MSEKEAKEEKKTNKTKLNLFEKIMEARVQLQKRNIKKTGYNKFSDFHYFELSDFLPHVNEIFKDLKLYSSFNIKKDDQGQELAILDIVNTENLNEKERYIIPTENVDMKQKIQALGGKITYCKRYLYMNLMEIAEPDLVDTVDNTKTDKNVINVPKKPCKNVINSSQNANKNVIDKAKAEDCVKILEYYKNNPDYEQELLKLAKSNQKQIAVNNVFKIPQEYAEKWLKMINEREEKLIEETKEFLEPQEDIVFEEEEKKNE